MFQLLLCQKKNDQKLLEQLKSRFKRTVEWNKYRSEMTVHSNNKNLNYLIDSTFAKVNRFFVLSFKRNAERDCKILFNIVYQTSK